MTVREYLDIRRMRALGAVGVGFGIIFFLALTATHSFVFMCLGFGIALAGVLYLNYGLRCPKCDGIVSYAVCWPVDPRFIYISDKVKFCPFCGARLDEEMS